MIFDSIENQVNSSELDVIFVDAGSDKKYKGYLREKVARIPNSKIIETPNSNFAVARNKGLEHAVGEYVIFWDQDGKAPPKALSKLKAAIDGYDLCVGSTSIAIQEIPEPENIDDMCYTNRKDADSLIRMLLNHNMMSVLSNILFRTEVIKKNHLTFDELAGEWGAADLFNLDYFLVAHSCRVIHSPVYTISIAVTPSEIIQFDGRRLLTEHKIKHRYKQLISTLKLEKETIDVTNTLALNKVYLAVSNMERWPYSIEDKMQYLQTIFNDEDLDELIKLCDVRYAFSYFFTEYLILAVLDSGNQRQYVRHFGNILSKLRSETHADIADENRLGAAIYKTRKLNASDNFLVPVIQANIYLSLLSESSQKGIFRQEYFDKCREKCLQAMNHKENFNRYGEHIYDAVRLDLD
jgi:glycosyltransferase involved in cell wall biosynthesis